MSPNARSDPESILGKWLERDLTASASELPPLFEMDDQVDRVCDVLASGRHPILTGDAGVGKTAVVYELVRRMASGTAPALLDDRRVLQLSLHRRASALKHHEVLGPATLELVEALLELGAGVLPFFRDFDLVYQFDVEPQLQTLAFRFPGIIIGEGDRSVIDAIFESSPEMEQLYTKVSLEEPSLERAQRIASAWGADRAERLSRRFTTGALQEALYLSHRFLTRSRFPRKVIDLLGQLEPQAAAGRTVTAGHVIEHFCAVHRVPRVLIDPEIPLDLADLEQRFSAKVLGQPEAVEAMVSMIGLIKAGLSDVRRPFGVFLFVGPTGVGKTHLAQLLAEFLFGSRERMIRLNMADFQQEQDAAVLFGNPDAHSAPQLRGQLTMRILGHPFAVLLLDEFEKAHEKIHDRFLQLFDEGAFINGADETVPCRSMIIIATSNEGADVYRGQAFGFAGQGDLADQDREMDDRLAQKFRFEFLNRFDRVVHFHPLSREDIRTIARRELEQLQDRAGLRQRQLSIEVDESVLDWLAVHGYDPDHGARFLRRTIERQVSTALAALIVRRRPEAGRRIALTVRGRAVAARLVEGPSPRSATAAPPASTPAPPRDPRNLWRDAEALCRRAESHLDALERHRLRRGELLEVMNADGFWGSDESREVLDQFRALDVAVQVETRLARPLQQLRRRVESAERGEAEPGLGAAVASARRALEDWERREAEEGPVALWLLIGNDDPIHPAHDWLQDLVRMELAWCRRHHLAARVVAQEFIDGEPNRVVLEVEGPGAGALLEMEHGVHRLCRRRDRNPRARVEVVARSAGPVTDDPGIRSAAGRRSRFGLTPSCRGRIEMPERGLMIELSSEHRATLAHVLHDLADHWRRLPADPPDLARVYGEDGIGARDPRTSASSARLRDVLRGRLTVFLDAWRDRAARPGRMIDAQPVPSGQGTSGDLADLVGTSQPNIARLESADCEGHSLAILQRIAAALHMRVELHFVPLDDAA